MIPTLKVRLASRGDVDHGQDPYKPVMECPDDEYIDVLTIFEARNLCRRYIEDYALTGSQWEGGQVVGLDGEHLALIRYNGKVKYLSEPSRILSPIAKKDYDCCIVWQDLDRITDPDIADHIAQIVSFSAAFELFQEINDLTTSEMSELFIEGKIEMKLDQYNYSERSEKDDS